MGLEANCRAAFNRKKITGKAHLETDVLEFRAPDVRVSIPFQRITKAGAHAGALTIESDLGTLSLTLGDAAPKWLAKIQNPPSRLDKIGVKPGWRVSALGMADNDFLRELEEVVGELSVGRTLKGSDAIFLGAAKEADLDRLAKFVPALKPNGALWVVRPKGRPEISERAVMAAGKAAGLVDVKVVSFSSTHTAEKFVIPVKSR
jgi:hypothetical protein